MRRLLPLILLAAAVAHSTRGAAQPVSAALNADAPGATLLPLAGPGVDRWRLEQLSGDVTTGAFLLRSPSSPRERAASSPLLAWAPVLPELTTIWNSALPFSLNDGALWAGRGYSFLLRAGARLDWGPITAVIAPEVVYAQNQPFQIFSREKPDQSQFSSPWHAGPQWADLPLRFGDEPLGALDIGQSSFFVSAGPVQLGASTENNWWGPGAHTALLLSNNAPGFAHLFLRSNGPIETSYGDFEGRWIAGGLTESLFFDSDPTNDYRSFSAMAGTFRLSAEPGVTLGLARVVYGTVGTGESVLRHSFDALTWWGSPATAAAPGVAEADPEDEETHWPQPTGPGKEQLLALFGRWVFPADRFEVYGEWSRTELPRSIVDLANQPTHSQGYTVGLQWAPEVSAEGAVRVHAEASYLEEGSTFDNRPTNSYYLSRSVAHGYTNRGKIVGAATGPGSSSQWITAEYLDRSWRAGVTGGRIRWENDEYLTDPERREVGHDVSLFGGVRAGLRVLPLSELGLEIIRGVRFNYLFQNPALEPQGRHALDIYNTTVRIGISTLLPQDP